MKRYAWPMAVVSLVCVLAGCGTASSSSIAGAPEAACAPTDQDKYVYDPRRLQVVQACIRVTGIVDAVEMETDGDTNFFLRLDPPYRGLLKPANTQEERGDLVVETVCASQPVQANAILICDGDPDPYAGPFPSVGAHVWMEGRYVLDLHHEGHSELHPLYRAGAVTS